MQFNLDSSPAMCIIKHMPPWRSVSENEGLSSADLAVPPTEKRPNPKIRAFKTNKMSKLVKLSVSTSDVDDALAKNSKAVVTNSVSAILSFFAEISEDRYIINWTSKMQIGNYLSYFLSILFLYFEPNFFQIMLYGWIWNLITTDLSQNKWRINGSNYCFPLYFLFFWTNDLFFLWS